jgi:esterase FrsA
MTAPNIRNPRSFLISRIEEFSALGIPYADIVAGQQEIERFSGSAEDQGAWQHFWRGRAAACRDTMPARASVYLGAAKYPVLGQPGMQAIIDEQRTLIKADQDFPFDCRWATVESRGDKIRVPFHVYGEQWRANKRLICICGGLDVYKCELHSLAGNLSNWTRCAVATVDMPGTGETLTGIDQQEDFFKTLFDCIMPDRQRTCLIGMSFGGYWALRLAFAGTVQCAVDIGGPAGVGTSIQREIADLPNEMMYVLLSAFQKLEAEVRAALKPLSAALQEHIREGNPVPIMAINGQDDPYIPESDVVFLKEKKYPNADVIIVPKCGHCAAGKLWWFVPKIIHWIGQKMEISGWRIAATGIADAAISRVLLSDN